MAHPTHPFLELQGQGADAWRVVASFLDGHNLVNLGLVSRQFGDLVLNDNLLWQTACFNFLGVPFHEHPPVDQDWKMIYSNISSSLDNFNIAFAIERMGAIYVEEPLLVTTQIHPNILSSLQDESKGRLVNGVKNGLWILNTYTMPCTCFTDECPRKRIYLEACAIEMYMGEAHLHHELPWEVLSTHDLPSDFISCGFFVTNNLDEASSQEVANPNLWASPNVWEIRSRIAPYAVGLARRIPNVEGGKAIIRVSREAEQAFALSMTIGVPPCANGF